MVLALAYLAGVLSILSPCVLPLVPVVLASAAQENRFGIFALTGGIVASFTTIDLLFAFFGYGLGLERDTLRTMAAALLIAAGAVMLVARLQLRLTTMAEPLIEGLTNFTGRFSARGLGGQAALGALLGVVWSPCAGPALGAAAGLAMQKGTLLSAGSVMLVFSAGAVTPLTLMAYAGRRAIGNRKTLGSIARYAKPATAILLIIIGLSIVTGFDKSAEALLTKSMPPWLVDLTTKF